MSDFDEPCPDFTTSYLTYLVLHIKPSLEHTSRSIQQGCRMRGPIEHASAPTIGFQDAGVKWSQE